MQLKNQEMELFDSPEFKSILSEGKANLLQNELLNESKLIRIARQFELSVTRVVTGEPGEFHQQGLLMADGLSARDEPLFHPFRLYVLDMLLKYASEPESSLAIYAETWNKVIDLTVILEPLFWPQITGMVRFGLDENNWYDQIDRYEEKVVQFISRLDPHQWKEIHDSLKFDALKKDSNSELYLLLRHSRWEKRKKLKGSIAAALWFRHIAELIRLSFESIHGIEWLEEDYATGHWPKGSRTNAYGSERPLDNPFLTRQYLAQSFGLLHSSVVRWYVEGATEYSAVHGLISKPHMYNIEVVDLKANISSDKQNIAMKLADSLIADIEQRRFSFITFDKDVSQNEKTIRRQAEKNRICGLVVAHDPDFEFANFDLNELVSIAANLDEANNYDPKAIIEADWSSITSAKEFEQMYKTLSERKTSLKGTAWGEALAMYMRENPERNGVERPFIAQASAAMRAVRVKYEFQRDNFIIDPETFENVKK